MLMYESSSNISEDSYLLVVPHKQKGKPELAKIEEPNSNANFTFDFQHMKYEIMEDVEDDEDMVGDGDYGCKLIQSYTGHARDHYKKSKGYIARIVTRELYRRKML